jgi:hypothetical protein
MVVCNVFVRCDDEMELQLDPKQEGIFEVATPRRGLGTRSVRTSKHAYLFRSKITVCALMKSMNLSLYRAELQRKLEAIDLILDESSSPPRYGRPPGSRNESIVGRPTRRGIVSAAGRKNLAASARLRWKKAKAACRNAL